MAKDPLIVALTASPGANKEKIMEVCDNLFVENIEVRTENDPDVKEYIQEVDIKFIPIEFPENFKSIRNDFNELIKSKVAEIKNHVEKGTYKVDGKKIAFNMIRDSLIDETV